MTWMISCNPDNELRNIVTECFLRYNILFFQY